MNGVPILASTNCITPCNHILAGYDSAIDFAQHCFIRYTHLEYRYSRMASSRTESPRYSRRSYEASSWPSGRADGAVRACLNRLMFFTGPPSKASSRHLGRSDKGSSCFPVRATDCQGLLCRQNLPPRAQQHHASVTLDVMRGLCKCTSCTTESA